MLPKQSALHAITQSEHLCLCSYSILAFCVVRMSLPWSSFEWGRLVLAGGISRVTMNCKLINRFWIAIFGPKMPRNLHLENTYLGETENIIKLLRQWSPCLRLNIFDRWWMSCRWKNVLPEENGEIETITQKDIFSGWQIHFFSFLNGSYMGIRASAWIYDSERSDVSGIK